MSAAWKEILYSVTWVRVCHSGPVHSTAVSGDNQFSTTLQDEKMKAVVDCCLKPNHMVSEFVAVCMIQCSELIDLSLIIQL